MSIRPILTQRSPIHPGVNRERGFTIIEMMLVMLVIGIMTGLMMKPISGAFAQTSRRAATREVATYILRARTVAVQQSRASQFVRNGNVMSIRVDSSGTKVRLGQARDLGVAYGVTLTSAPASATDTIRFDTRGFTANAATLPKIIITRSGVDTLCISGLGRVSSRKCA